MKIFITGATGYIGHQLALKLAQKGNCVNALVRDTCSPNLPDHPNIRIYSGDVTRMDTIIAAMRGCDYVFHLASMVKLFSRDPSLIHRINVGGTKNILEACVALGVRRIVFTGTCPVSYAMRYRVISGIHKLETMPSNGYDQSKFLAECAGEGIFFEEAFGCGYHTAPKSLRPGDRNPCVKRE